MLDILIAKQSDDIERFEGYIKRLRGQSGTAKAVGDFQRIIAAANICKKMLTDQSARCRCQ
jgi:hypothetical protein